MSMELVELMWHSSFLLSRFEKSYEFYFMYYCFEEEVLSGLGLECYEDLTVSD